MILFLYSDRNLEYQTIACIKSLQKAMTDDIRIVYYTIGFSSDFEMPNCQTIEVDFLKYDTFNYFKPELSLKTLELFPDETDFIYCDTDVLFSKRFDFSKLVFDYPYPVAPNGPHASVYIYDAYPDGTVIYHNEQKLMKYFNVSERSCVYTFSCFYTFNRSCEDFFEEWKSMVDNTYLLKTEKEYFPFYDETPFNVCLWKRGATHTLGMAFVNTHQLDFIKMVEESDDIVDTNGHVIDTVGGNWEYVQNSANVLFYHGAKTPEDVQTNLEYLTYGKV